MAKQKQKRPVRTYEVVPGRQVNLGDLVEDAEPELVAEGERFEVDERHFETVARWERDGYVTEV